MQDEESLVRRACRRDPEAFNLLYEAYFDRVYRYVAVRIGSRLEAEDLTQEVFMKALQAIPAFKWSGAPFLAWLYRIAHNKVVDHFRKVKPVTVAIEMAEAVESDDPATMCEYKNEVEWVLRSARQLTQAQQEVVALRFVADLSVAETAGVMEKSEGAVKALQHSALVALRKVMAQSGTRAREHE